MQELFEWGTPEPMKMNGFVLHQDEELEDDNRKIFHDIVTPDGKRHMLHHTPYEVISGPVFRKYIDFYARNKRFPNYGEIQNGNADNDAMLRT